MTKLDTLYTVTPNYHTPMFTRCKRALPDTDFSKLAPSLTKTAQIPVLLKSLFAPCPIMPRSTLNTAFEMFTAKKIANLFVVEVCHLTCFLNVISALDIWLHTCLSGAIGSIAVRAAWLW